jgi:indolepyruvate ferredoxin oxidoreductase beta subunit
MKSDIILAGVGGQGVLTVAQLLAEAALAEGFQVLQGELHGMSQRGGAVQAQLRIADHPIESPQVLVGAADLLVGVEPVETLRNLQWLAPGGAIVSATRPVPNVSDYPPLDDVLGALRAVPGAVLLDAHGIAVAAGSARAENFVVAGAGAALLPLRRETVVAAVTRRAVRWSARDREAALRALAAGYAAVTQPSAAAHGP